jgi:tetratricopeptide (TPR) repeat protein
VHGLFYDYLYSGKGTVLLFYPLGMAMTGVLNQSRSKEQASPDSKIASPWYRVGFGLLLSVIVVLALNLNKVLSLWYANRGAIQMSQAELKDFPVNEWRTSEFVPRLELAETTFQTTLLYQPHNQTANYRLGLISMLRQDFNTAAANLEVAHQEAPNHRGIMKSLAYCYVWLGEIDKAQTLLDQIPEAKHEMEVYIWWWGTQGRPDLSEKAAIAFSQLNSSPP